MTTMRWQRLCVLVAGLSGAMAVAFAAMSAHGTEAQAADWLERGSRFQLIHAVVLLVLGLGRGQGTLAESFVGSVPAGDDPVFRIALRHGLGVLAGRLLRTGGRNLLHPGLGGAGLQRLQPRITSRRVIEPLRRRAAN